ncbi:MAG: tetratricopeptide repeat protein, partial [Kofleriaceae bacterium]
PALRARLVGRGGDEARLLRLQGEIARARGERDAAIRLHTTSYTVARAARHPTAAAMAAASLVWVHGLYGEDLARASDWAEIAKAQAASLGDHEVGVTVHYALGALADRRGDLPLALAEFQRAQAAAARELGPEHFTTATVTVAVASVLGALGRFEEAIAPHRAAIETLSRWESPRSRGVARALYNLALTESSAGRHAEAERDASRSLEISVEIGEPELQATALHNLGVVRIGAGKLAAAAPLFDQAIARFEAIGLSAAAGSSRVHRAIATTPAAVASRSAAAIARVRTDLVEGRDANTAAYGADDLAAIDAEVALADLFSPLGRCGEASPLLARAEAGYERARAPEVVRGKLRPPRERCAGSR